MERFYSLFITKSDGTLISFNTNNTRDRDKLVDILEDYRIQYTENVYKVEKSLVLIDSK